jgi:hypothetical protein
MRTSAPTWLVAISEAGGTLAANIRSLNLWQHQDMNDEPELIATLQVGMAASGECPECHEIFMVKSRSGRPEPLSNRLRQIFEEHVRGVDPSKKAIG